MNTINPSEQVLHDLEHALNTGHIPDEEKRRAAQLLTRLKSTVQVVVIGSKRSGKSRLINMLTGTSIVPDATDIPPLEIVYGSNPNTVYLAGNGSEQRHEGLCLDQPIPEDTAIIRVALPLNILKTLSLTEVCLQGGPSDQQAITTWATNRADIVLWCSQDFDAPQQALWSGASETLKDHSFLVLTKADQLQMKGVLTTRITDLENIVSEEFFRMYPVATIQAISASPQGNDRDEDLWATSGAKALMNAILKLVENGRRADADNALIFLKRNSVQVPETPENLSIQQEKPTLAGVENKPVVATETPDSTSDTQVLKDALTFLQNRANQMLRAIGDGGSDKQAFVLDHCLETAKRLTEIIMEIDSTDQPISDLQDDVMECGDMMVLFHLEKTENAADDAVTLLLQLKKEMAIAVCA